MMETPQKVDGMTVCQTIPLETAENREESMQFAPLPENYMPLALKLGLTPQNSAALLQVESFDLLKAKVRQLALLSGFQVKLDGRSDKRRHWKCTSRRHCPFAVIGNRNRYGIIIKSTLQHNHVFHVHEELNKRFTTGTTHELACIVRRSDLYSNGLDFLSTSGQQIADCVYHATGFHINQMRASRIRKMIMDDPDRYLLSTTLTESQPSPSTNVLLHANTTEEMDIWECFVSIANDPYVLSTLGITNVKKMIATFKQEQHKPILRAIFRMSCPNANAFPSMTQNAPTPMKFLECYQRQVILGFFD